MIEAPGFILAMRDAIINAAPQAGFVADPLKVAELVEAGAAVKATAPDRPVRNPAALATRRGRAAVLG